MADTNVSVTTLTAGTVGADIITNGEGGTTVAAGNTAVIDVANDPSRVLIIIASAGSAATATVQAGDYPLAVRSGLGAGTAQTVPASDVLPLCIEAARHVHDDGKVRIDIGTNNCVVSAWRLPKTIG